MNLLKPISSVLIIFALQSTFGTFASAAIRVSLGKGENSRSYVLEEDVFFQCKNQFSLSPESREMCYIAAAYSDVTVEEMMACQKKYHFPSTEVLCIVGRAKKQSYETIEKCLVTYNNLEQRALCMRDGR